MRTTALIVSMLALAAAPALAQTAAPQPIARPGNPIGERQSLPASNAASNISSTDTRSTIAPTLPAPAIADGAPPLAFLQAARDALSAGRTGEAQEALERAESRALDRSVPPSQASTPDQRPLVQQITDARNALAGGDSSRTMQLINDAMSNPDANRAT